MENERDKGEVLKCGEEGGGDGELGRDDGEALERVETDESGVDVALFRVMRVSARSTKRSYRYNLPRGTPLR